MSGFGRSSAFSRRPWTITALCLGLLVYFAYHERNGEWGSRKLDRLSASLETRQETLSILRDQKEKMELRRSSLDSEFADRDLLDENARRLGYLVAPDEQVLHVRELSSSAK